MLIPTTFGDERIFLEISEPISYQEYIATVITEFDLETNCAEIELFVNKIRVKESQFVPLIEQYSKSFDFFIDVKVREIDESAHSISLFSSKASESSITFCDFPCPTTEFRAAIPTINCIKKLPQICRIYEDFNKGIALQNKERVKVAKAIIDECLILDPQIVLSRKDFQNLAAIIKNIFPGEVESAYYIPSSHGVQARGKLWSAYNNKRTALSVNGQIQRRPKVARRCEKSLEDITLFESIEFLEENISDWPTTLEKWRQTHTHRRNELNSNIATVEYILKYPALQNINAVDLVTIDVKILYPLAANIDNSLSKYKKIVDRARNLRDAKVTELITEIDSSTDERYKAGLSLLLIPYILPHCGKRVEKRQATKREIQENFIKEYSSIFELNNEPNLEINVAFVREKNQFVFAEFRCTGFKYKCCDLLEVVNTAFMFMIALDLQFPKLCKHVWQFVQLAIYEIELPLKDKVPCIESTVNDIFK